MDEQVHPIIRELRLLQPFKSKIEERAVNAVIRRIWYAQTIRRQEWDLSAKRHEWVKIVDLDYGQFLQELQKDDGGLVGMIPTVGKLSLEALRERLLFAPVEYGYA